MFQYNSAGPTAGMFFRYSSLNHLNTRDRNVACWSTQFPILLQKNRILLDQALKFEPHIKNFHLPLPQKRPNTPHFIKLRCLHTHLHPSSDSNKHLISSEQNLQPIKSPLPRDLTYIFIFHPCWLCSFL